MAWSTSDAGISQKDSHQQAGKSCAKIAFAEAAIQPKSLLRACFTCNYRRSLHRRHYFNLDHIILPDQRRHADQRAGRGCSAEKYLLRTSRMTAT